MRDRIGESAGCGAGGDFAPSAEAAGASSASSVNGTNSVNGAFGANGVNGATGANSAIGAAGANSAAGTNDTAGALSAAGMIGASCANGANSANGAAYECRVKICGIRRPEDVEYANLCLPDYIGFVFADSRRRVSASEAAALRRRLDRRILAVGVFAGADVGEPARLCADGVIDLAQLHGDEDEGYMRRLSALVPNPLIRAVRVRLPPATDYLPPPDGCLPLADCLLPAGCLPQADYLLFDAWHPRLRGGSGERFDWEGFRERAAGAGKPFFLAGGLDPGNAAAAIRLLRPYALDVSSGVETGGAKDYGKMAAFVRAVRGACAEAERGADS
ncbi:MAG: phosphoribosylanthranilate isomerase [Clostridiales bacterium]|jgi:phosphoribosylanthranilate isomerase|nr:phosphoribosylanthranilate isomerase [Clostridiales bacterium]